ncbi:MAG: DUF998 domain-containing protein [Candidatus Korarchaeota archaeon]|nr:DUF998 domain-containing protein [Candidatus Korarchaeota archaeon]
MVRLLKLWGLTGLSSLAVALTTIFVCWYMNPWFDFWRDAFSDFGVSRACCPWLYNYGLIASAFLLLIYSLFILRASKSKLESFSSGLLFTASIFLALIGVFPGGTRPHTFISTWFFVQAFMGLTVLGIALLVDGHAKGIFVALLSGSAPILAILVDLTVRWPSAAVAEAAGILIIGMSVFTITPHYLNITEEK